MQQKQHTIHHTQKLPHKTHQKLMRVVKHQGRWERKKIYNKEQLKVILQKRKEQKCKTKKEKGMTNRRRQIQVRKLFSRNYLRWETFHKAIGQTPQKVLTMSQKVHLAKITSQVSANPKRIQNGQERNELLFSLVISKKLLFDINKI